MGTANAIPNLGLRVFYCIYGFFIVSISGPIVRLKVHFIFVMWWGLVVGFSSEVVPVCMLKNSLLLFFFNFTCLLSCGEVY